VCSLFGVICRLLKAAALGRQVLLLPAPASASATVTEAAALESESGLSGGENPSGGENGLTESAVWWLPSDKGGEAAATSPSPRP
jgi:hypothetical protein